MPFSILSNEKSKRTAISFWISKGGIGILIRFIFSLLIPPIKPDIFKLNSRKK